MTEKWKVLYYETSQGKSPVFDFVQNLDVRAQNKVSNILDLLMEFGTKISPPHSKKLTGTPLWELRILAGNNIRIFYAAVVSQTFLLLHAFQKKKQKTDRKEIKIAVERLNDYNLRLK